MFEFEMLYDWKNGEFFQVSVLAGVTYEGGPITEDDFDEDGNFVG